MLFLMRSGQSDAKNSWLLAAGKINNLPGSGQFGRQVSDGFGGIDEDGEEFMEWPAPPSGIVSSPEA